LASGSATVNVAAPRAHFARFAETVGCAWIPPELPDSSHWVDGGHCDPVVERLPLTNLRGKCLI
jgi:hypothetical protein